MNEVDEWEWKMTKSDRSINGRRINEIYKCKWEINEWILWMRMEDELNESMNGNGIWMNRINKCERKMNEWGWWMWIEDEWMRSMNVNGRWMTGLDKCAWRMNV